MSINCIVFIHAWKKKKKKDEGIEKVGIVYDVVWFQMLCETCSLK